MTDGPLEPRSAGSGPPPGDAPPGAAGTGDGGTAPDPGDLVGTVLAGRYRILRRLGAGAMGAVYLGEHLKIGRQDAIKVLRSTHAGDAEAIARFLRGARNVSQIRHPNVCTIYDFSDTDDGLQFMAMEFIPGETLKDMLQRENTLPFERAVAIAIRVADALHAAHEAGIVHRDLKPANIMISPGRDGSDEVKVVDFDIAKGSHEGEESEVTRLGFVVGTPEYMSPEQLMGERLDGRSDIYSLALVLFRMLTGSLPFRADSTQDIMIQRLTHSPLRLDEALPQRAFPPALQSLLDRALARKAEDRPATAQAFALELAAAAGSAAAGAAGGADAGAGGGMDAAGATAGAGAGATPAGRGTTAGAEGARAGAEAAARRAAGATDELPATRVSAPLAGTAAAPAPGSPPAGSARSGRRTGLIAAAAAVVLVAGLGGAWALFGGDAGGGPVADPPARTDLADGTTAGDGDSDGGGSDADLVAGGPPGDAGGDADRTGESSGGDSGTGRDGGDAEPAGPTNGGRAGEPGGATAESNAPAGPSIALAGVNDMLWRQFDRYYELVGGATDPPRGALVGIRDTARTIWDLPGVGARDRAFAAYILGNVLLPLGDTVQGRTWAERAFDLCPDCSGYLELVQSYRSLRN